MVRTESDRPHVWPGPRGGRSRSPVFGIGPPANDAARLVAAAAGEVRVLPLVREERLNRLFVEGGHQLAHFVLEDVVVATEVDWRLPLRDGVELFRVPESRLNLDTRRGLNAETVESMALPFDESFSDLGDCLDEEPRRFRRRRRRAHLQVQQPPLEAAEE